MKVARRVRRALVGTGTAGLLAASMVVSTGVGTAGAQSGSNQLTVTAGEYVYKLSGKPKPGNVELMFDNQGVEIHMIAMAQVKKNTKVNQLKKALLSEDETAADKYFVSEVAPLPGLLGPGRASTTVVDLDAGKYALLCFIPDPEGVPHLAHGMIKLVTVKGAESSFAPPTDGVVEVSVSDSAITLPDSGLPKSAWAKITNDTSVSRSVLLAEYVTPDATFETADAYYDALFQGGAEGDPPAELSGGVESLAPNASAYIKVDLSAGRYVLVSENEDVDDDPSPLHTDFTVS